MPKVDIVEMEKKAAQKEVDTNQIKTKLIGDKTVFQGPFLKDWFDTYGECQSENQKFAQQKSYKDQGLDEFGRNQAQVALSKKKQELIKKKESILEEARKIDLEIGSLNEEDFKKESKKK